MSRDAPRPQEIVIDPRDFISGPYTKCPKCKRPDSFGLLWVSRDSYSKRCRECRHLQGYSLPKLKKKVVYIDQFAISGIAKALSSKLGSRDTTDKFWRRLFEKVDELVKLQLVICPTSHFHEQESLFYERESLKRMYEHLSGGVTFYDPVTIRRFQVIEYFRQLQAGRTSPELRLERRHVVSGDLNEWQEKFNLTVSFEPRQEEIDELADARRNTTTALRDLVDYWKSRKGKKWRDFSRRRRSPLVNCYGKGTSPISPHCTRRIRARSALINC